jgi:hypothetical protein
LIALLLIVLVFLPVWLLRGRNETSGKVPPRTGTCSYRRNNLLIVEEIPAEETAPEAPAADTHPVQVPTGQTEPVATTGRRAALWVPEEEPEPKGGIGRRVWLPPAWLLLVAAWR